MIIKRNERKERKRSTDYYHSVMGISIRARFSASICLSIFPLSPPAPSTFYNPPAPICIDPNLPLSPLFTPTNGGSFCFTFDLISDEREKIFAAIALRFGASCRSRSRIFVAHEAKVREQNLW